jgi:hypothetical protein
MQAFALTAEVGQFRRPISRFPVPPLGPVTMCISMKSLVMKLSNYNILFDYLENCILVI